MNSVDTPKVLRSRFAVLLCMMLAVSAFVVALAAAVPSRALAADPVCSVNGTNYDDLGVAIDEAPDGASVVLLSDASVSGVKRIDKSLSFDLGGNVLTCGTLNQTSPSYSLAISNGNVNGLVSAKNLTLTGVTVSGNTQNGGVVSASASSAITDCVIANTYDVVNGRTSAALSIGGSGSHTVTGCTFSGKSAIYFNNPSGVVRLDNCTATGLVSGSSALNMYASGDVDVALTNCVVTAHGEGKAFSGSWNMAGVIEFGQGNAFSGPIVVSGRDNSSNVYELKVSGGTFSNGGQMPFVPQAPEFNAQMLERLNVVGGTFDMDVTPVLRSGFQCFQNLDGTWSVSDDVTAPVITRLPTMVRRSSMTALPPPLRMAREPSISPAMRRSPSMRRRLFPPHPGRCQAPPAQRLFSTAPPPSFCPPCLPPKISTSR